MNEDKMEAFVAIFKRLGNGTVTRLAKNAGVNRKTAQKYLDFLVGKELAECHRVQYRSNVISKVYVWFGDE